MKEIALTGVLVESDHQEERVLAQTKLMTLVQALNSEYQALLGSPFEMTSTTEFRALLKPSEKVFQLLDDLRMILLPDKVKIGIGVGQVERRYYKTNQILLDGPAFIFAKQALKDLEDKDDYGTNQLRVLSGRKDRDDTINAILAACFFISASWTRNQELVLLKLLDLGIYDETFSNKDLSQSLEISASALTKRVKASGLKVYLRNRRIAAQLLYKITEE